jgi:hypothetical protein
VPDPVLDLIVVIRTVLAPATTPREVDEPDQQGE